MRLSEFIERAETILAENGDMEVVISQRRTPDMVAADMTIESESDGERALLIH
ncbi:hypothetical protein AB0G29_12900 [Streptomyces parvus]|uniref:hypothetical protein n=1 Tax=Streptomyces parvus TaxID=66428 RepID=UPI0033D5F58B